MCFLLSAQTAIYKYNRDHYSTREWIICGGFWLINHLEKLSRENLKRAPVGSREMADAWICRAGP